MLKQTRRTEGQKRIDKEIKEVVREKKVGMEK
jgi:hypothetical protein